MEKREKFVAHFEKSLQGQSTILDAIVLIFAHGKSKGRSNVKMLRCDSNAVFERWAMSGFAKLYQEHDIR